MEIPEILYKICEFDIKNIMSYLLLSKRVNKYILNREDVIIRKTLYGLEKRIFEHSNLKNHSKDNTALENHITSLQLSKWMVEPFSLPSSELVSKILQTVQERKYDKMLTENYFITGGAITQLALDMYWESDVDILITCENKDEERKEKRIIDGVEYDIIRKHVTSLEKVLRRVDVSLCQIGVLVTPKDLTVYATPLFLCAIRHKIMPIQVADLSDTYLQVLNGRYIENAFKKHILFHLENDFINCKDCIRDRYIVKDCRMSRWNTRVQKYIERFPDYKVSYYFARK